MCSLGPDSSLVRAPKSEWPEKHLRDSSNLFLQAGFFLLLLCFVSDNLKKDSILECRVGWGLFSCQLQGEAKIRTNEVK